MWTQGVLLLNPTCFHSHKTWLKSLQHSCHACSLNQSNDCIFNSSQSLFLGGIWLTRPLSYTFLKKRAGGIPLLFLHRSLGCAFSLHGEMRGVRRDKEMRKFLGDRWDELNTWQTQALGTAPVCVAVQQSERQKGNSLFLNLRNRASSLFFKSRINWKIL